MLDRHKWKESYTISVQPLFDQQMSIMNGWFDDLFHKLAKIVTTYKLTEHNKIVLSNLYDVADFMRTEAYEKVISMT